MKKIVKITAFLGFASLLLNSCGPKDNPPLVFFPDMYYPVAYDPLMKAEDAYKDHQNQIPAFMAQGGGTALSPVEGTVPMNKEGILPYEVYPKTPDEYNTMYDDSKNITQSPLDSKNLEKDLARGKKMYELTCAACHGTAGDGQGPMVVSGAYAGVPAYKDRQITVGSVHYVLTNGRNAMGSFAGQLTPADQWRVSMFVMNEFKGGINISAVAPTTATPATIPAAK